MIFKAWIIFASTIYALMTGLMLLTVRNVFSMISSFFQPIYPDSLISKMEENSGVKFHEAQVALARQWVGVQSNAGEDPIKEVFIKMPQATTEGIVQTKATDTKTEKVPLPASDEEARQKIEAFEAGADSIRSDEEVADTVSQHMMSDKTSLLEEKWLGTEEEEKDA